MMKTTVRGVRSVEIEMSQPERAAEFYSKVWNLTEVERSDGSIWFRGTGAYHHILAIHPAPKARDPPLTFDAASKDIVARAAQEGRRPAAARPKRRMRSTGPGGGYGFGFADLGGPQPRGGLRRRRSHGRRRRAGPAAQDRPCQSQRRRAREEQRIPDRRAGLPQGRPQRPAALLPLRQHRPLVDGDGADRDADAQPRLVRDARLELVHARRRADARRRLSDRMGRRAATAPATTCSAISRDRRNFRSSTPPR